MMLLPLNSEKLSLDQQSLTSTYPIPEKRALSKTALYGVVIACVYSTSLLTKSALNIRGMCVPAELQMFNFHEYLPLLFIHPADAFVQQSKSLPEVDAGAPVTGSCRCIFLKKTLLSKKRCDYSSIMILRSSHAKLGCASMKAEILHFQTCLD
ncbi:hypothetical protein T02_15978 [Trichinella nativa]|uniref:Uncharacterized protein n=1 Tax=Trichinella nativa TaxID=6335 RepID=A0A0V1L8S4_9BILA|nr:hypothetical protein T02_15978 [Trichinella nativa]